MNASGLSEKESRRRLKKFGPNEIRPEKKITLLQRTLLQLRSPVILVLLVAAALSGIFGDLFDAGAIVSIVLLNLAIALAQESRAQAAVEALKKLSAPRARVIRDGDTKDIPAVDLVPGDLIVLEAGDFVPADAQVIEGYQLSADESLLTGESMPVDKEIENTIFAGTTITTGSASALVTTTGMETEIGKIAGMLETATPQLTPLQIRMQQSSRFLLALTGVVVGIVAFLGVVQGQPWLQVVMTAISLAVAAVPEGLPTIATLALALAVRRMAKRNAIVRHLTAVETLGSTTVICADKTGTLTTGKMEVRETVTDAMPELAASMVLCNNAFFHPTGASGGDPTEIALLRFAYDHSVISKDMHNRHPRVMEWSFDSDRKRMSVAVKENGGLSIHVKGAPESVLPLCNLETKKLQRILEEVTALSLQGRRVLAVAKKSFESEEPVDWKNFESAHSVEHSLSFIGLVALSDPPRPETPDAVKACQKAGIRVVMITGDHPVTANAVARELGILGQGQVISGEDLVKMTPDELEAKVESVTVYARVLPAQKLEIVKAWKSLGHVVAMTGDGVNDAPALKEASIGISMGKGGTEVARSASALILTDDHFETIVAAVEEGRVVYGNIRRTILYLLSGNLAEVLIMLGAALIALPSPLAPIHLLWINLVTDGFPALALAAEPVPRNILHLAKKPSPASFFDRSFYSQMIFSGVIVVGLGLATYAYGYMFCDMEMARTYVFSFIVFEELFRSFAFRSEFRTYFQSGVWSNVYHSVSVAIPLGLQLLFLNTPFFQHIFKVAPLSLTEYGVILAISLIPVTLLEIWKLARHSIVKTSTSDKYRSA